MALDNVKNEGRERRIVEMMKKKEIDSQFKTCPNCASQFSIAGIKCPQCGVYYQKFLNEHPELKNKDQEEEPETWNAIAHYNHVPNNHPESAHKVTLFDPLLANPNSKHNILALCHHLKTCAEIDNESSSLDHQDGKSVDRKWCYVAADAAIANQVCEA